MSTLNVPLTDITKLNSSYEKLFKNCTFPVPPFEITTEENVQYTIYIFSCIFVKLCQVTSGVFQNLEKNFEKL